MSSSNRPTICSSDGRNCISFTSRLQLDFGGYNYRPNTTATTPQDLVGGVIARRAQFGVIGTFLDDWVYSVVFEGGGAGGPTGVNLHHGYVAYSGFKPFKIWGGIFGVPYTLDEATGNNNITFMERAAPQAVAVGIGAATRTTFGVTANQPSMVGRRLPDGTGLRQDVAGSKAGRRDRAGGVPAGSDRQRLAPDRRQRAISVRRADGRLGTQPARPDRNAHRRQPHIGYRTTSDKSARVLSAELAGTLGSFHFQGEYFDFNVERTLGNGPSLDFNGYYLQGGYILTGEKRSYSASSGSYSTVTPSRPFDWKTGGWGAWEIAARYSMIDLNDKDILGGRQENVTVGLNWYVNRNIRFMLNYINGKVDKRSAGGDDIGAKYQAVGGRAQIAF